MANEQREKGGLKGQPVTLFGKLGNQFEGNGFIIPKIKKGVLQFNCSIEAKHLMSWQFDQYYFISAKKPLSNYPS